MILGVDFDNTIVCYDALFHRLAVERGLIPAALPAEKGTVRDYLRRQGREDDWTELQGYAYGLHIADAVPFPGVCEFFRRCHAQSVPICIISHKTRWPVRGPQVDLHQAARGWLAAQRFHEADHGGLSASRVFFEVTKLAKLQRIVHQNCTHFVDDLPEFLREPGFPAGVERVLFDPWDRTREDWPFQRVSNWEQLEQLLWTETD
jgi:hypothetical protein